MARCRATNAVANAEIAVRRLLGELGYLDAAVTSTTVPTHENERATLVFNVTLGEPIRVGAVTVTNHSPWTDATVLERAGVAEGGVYRQREVQTAMASLQEEIAVDGLLRGRGDRLDRAPRDGRA
jgi:outer membrane protein assembly factor BamA